MTATLVAVDVFLRVFVSGWAMCFQAIERPRTDAVLCFVHFLSDDSQMSDIHARPVSTAMVDLQVILNWTIDKLPTVSVRHDHLAVKPKLHIAASASTAEKNLAWANHPRRGANHFHKSNLRQRASPSVGPQELTKRRQRLAPSILRVVPSTKAASNGLSAAPLELADAFGSFTGHGPVSKLGRVMSGPKRYKRFGSRHSTRSTEGG